MVLKTITLLLSFAVLYAQEDFWELDHEIAAEGKEWKVNISSPTMLVSPDIKLPEEISI